MARVGQSFMAWEATKSRNTAPVNERDAREFNGRGLFIGGCPKSGTTLLMSLLDNHPQLVVLPEETHYLEERRGYLALDNYEAKLRRLLEKSELRLLATGAAEREKGAAGDDVRSYRDFDYQNFAALAKEFARQPWINDSLLFSEMVRAYGLTLGADLRNCVRWVEKSTNNEVCVAALDQLFPKAKVIQLMRDPRAVFASRKGRQVKGRGRYSKAHRLAREWNRNAREIPRLRRDPSRFLIIRYEDLVADPRASMEMVCRFAGLDFNESLLEPTRAGAGWQGNSAFHKAFRGISAASVDQWKQSLTQHEIWWIELHCRKGMEVANYPLQTNARFSLSRWLRRLPDESGSGYFRARRGSLCQAFGLLKECRYG
jgi:hypothetical protein